MKKKYFYLLSALFVAVLSIGFAACGDDDDEGGGGSSSNVLVGTWSRTVTGSCSGTESFTFNANGTGTFNMSNTCNSGSFPFTYSIISYVETSGIGYVRVIYSNENRKEDIDFTLHGSSLYIAGATYTK